MSSGSTMRRPNRTYGRGKESPASRAFDDLISNKPAPIKAASTSTKWGKTNFIAVRESPRKKSSPSSTSSSKSSTPRKSVTPKIEMESDDIFSFDEDSPRKGKSAMKRASAATASTKLPATRIAVKAEEMASPDVQSEETTEIPENSDDELEEEPIVTFTTQRIIKTYSRQTAVINRNSYTRTPSIIKQTTETLNLDSSSSPSTASYTTSQISTEEEQQATESEHDAFGFSQLDSTPPTLSGPFETEDAKVEVKTYTRKVDTTMPGWSNYEYPKRVRNSKYNNPKLLENFKKMWDEGQKNKRSDVGSFAHSNVVSKSQFKSGDKTTMVVVCKPKVVSKTDGDVQNKYFGQPGREFPRGYKPNVVVDQTLSSNSSQRSNADSDSEFPDSPSMSSSQNNSQESRNSSVDEGSRLEPKLDINLSTNSKPIPVSSLKSVIPGNRIFRSRAAKNGASEPPPPEPVMDPQDDEESSMEISSQDLENVVVKPIRSGYRIFKSRAPKDEVKVETPEELFDEDIEMKADEHIAEEPPILTREDTLELKDNDDSISVDSRNYSQISNPEESDAESRDNASDVISLDNVDSPSNGDNQPKARKIFKTRNSKKTSVHIQKSPSKAIYNARSWHSDELSPEVLQSRVVAKTGKRKAKDESVVNDVPSLKMKRNVHWPAREGEEAYTSLKVNKEHKELFTVVRNVKESFEMQESGETQEFADDVEYLLDSLKNTEPNSIRCISCIQLAQKCKLPAFRMHLRAHGTVTRIFTMLHDACTDPSMSLCTATIMFMLSQDRLNMDLDTESLNLMLRLLEVDSDKEREKQYDQSTKKELEKNKFKVKQLCEQLRKAGFAKTLDFDCLTTGNLAMESLLSLTSRRAGEWFKEELRSQGALDHIVDTIASCSKCAESVLLMDSSKTLPIMKKLDRCLRVLENITYMNTDNQSYLIDYKEALLISSLCGALKGCVQCLPSYPVTEDPEENKEVKESVGWITFNCMLAVLRVLLNVTHDNDVGSAKVGAQECVINIVLECILSITQFIPQEQKFDLLVLSLGLLINLVEHSEMNRQILIDSEVSCLQDDQTIIKTGISCLVELFCEREEAARQMEDKEEEGEGSKSKPTETQKDETSDHNKSGEWEETETGVQWIVKSAESIKAANQAKCEEEPTNAKEDPSPLDDDETFTKALHKAGKHMENSIVASYIALLLGCLIRDNKDYVDSVKMYLPNQSFEAMIKTLKKFLGFMNLTIAIGNTGGKSIARVIEVLESC